MHRIIFVLLCVAGESRAYGPDWPMPYQNAGLTRVVIGAGAIRTPAVRWKKRLGGTEPTTLVQDVTGDGRLDILVLGSGRLMCLDPESGTVRWATETLNLGFFLQDDDGTSRDLDGDGTVDVLASKVSMGDTRVYAVNGTSGQVEWTFGEGLGPSSGVNGRNRAWVGNVDDDAASELILYVPSNATGAKVYGFDFGDGFGPGALKWTASWATPYGGNIDFGVFDALGDGARQVMVNVKDALYVYDARTGAPIGHSLAWYGPTPSIAYGRRPYAVQADDDGARELFFAHEGAHSYWGVWELATDGRAQARWMAASDRPVAFAPLVDMDGDGREEVVTSELTTQNGGRWVTTVREAAGGEPRATIQDVVVTGHAGDVSGDGRPDVTVFSSPGERVPTYGTVQALTIDAQGDVTTLWTAGIPKTRIAGLVRRAAPYDELVLMLDQDGDDSAESLLVVDGTADIAQVVAQKALSKNDLVPQGAYDDLAGEGLGQLLVYSRDGFLDVLDGSLSPVSARMPTPGINPRLLTGALVEGGPVQVVAYDSLGRALAIQGGSGSIHDAPKATGLFDEAGVEVLALVDVEHDGGPREILAHAATRDLDVYQLLEADGETVRWKFTLLGGNGGIQSGAAGTGGDLDGDGVWDFFLMVAVDGVPTDVPVSGKTGKPLGWSWVPRWLGDGSGTAYSPALMLESGGKGDVLISHMADAASGAAGGPPAPFHLLGGVDGSVLATATATSAPARVARAELDGHPDTVEILYTHWSGWGALGVVDSGGESSLVPLWKGATTGPLSRGHPMVVDLDGDGLDDLLHHDPSVATVRALRGKDGYPLWAERRLVGGDVWVRGLDSTFTGQASGQVTADPGMNTLDERAIVVTDLTGLGHVSAVYGGGDGVLYFVNAETGALDWTYDFGFRVSGVAAADLEGDGLVELLVAVEDGFVYALGPAADLGAPGEVRDGAGPDVDEGGSEGSGIGLTKVAANWDPPAGGSEATLGYYVRLVTATGAVVMDWHDAGAQTSFAASGYFTLSPGVAYRFVVLPYGTSAAGAAARSDGFTLPDKDGDGIVDGTEVALGTDPERADSDADGIADGIETNGGKAVDTDGDGVIDALDGDSDADTLEDAVEREADSDGDGVGDWRDPDDDEDALPTLHERLDAARLGDDVDCDGVFNWLDTDSDGDALADHLEGTRDDDGDGVPDYLDPLYGERCQTLPAPPPADSGCLGCRTGRSDPSAPASLVALALLLLGVRRRAARP